MLSMPVIHYERHPAFVRERRECIPEDDGIVTLITVLDHEFTAACTRCTDAPANEFARLATDKAVELARLCRFSRDLTADTVDRVNKALAQTAMELTAIVNYLAESNAPPKLADAASDAVAAQIADDGIAVTQIPDKTISLLRDGLRHQIDEVRRMAARNPRDRRSLPLQLTGKPWETLWAALHEAGIIGGVAIHEGRDIRPMNWSLMQNSPEEQWYKDCYADCGVATSPLAYMHYDHDCNYAKIQVYLSDVDLDAAPFSYIPGSHTWQGSPTQQMIFKTLDMAFATLPKAAGDVYYRTRFKNPAYRREFLKLPTAFQGTSHFGDDVLPESELGQELMQRERFVTSDVGNCMVFTGGKALHRGGMARAKERLVLQVGVSAKPPVSWSLEKKSIKQVTAERVGRFLRATIGDAGTEAIGRRVRRVFG